MGLKLSGSAPGDPITAAQARTHLREVTDLDADLSRLVQAATSWAEKYTRRAFVTRTYDYTLQGWPPCIVLPKPPHQSVTSITYVDGAGSSVVLDTAEYQVDLSSGSLAARIRPAYQKTWPTTRLDIFNPITVRFVAGYGAADAVPEDIISGILLMIGHLYENRQTVVIGAAPADLPMGAKALLDPYRDPDSAF